MDDENRISDSDPYSHSWEDGIDFTRINTKKLLVLNFRVLQLSRVETLQQELFDMQTRFALEGTRMDSTSRASSIEKLDETLQKIW